jgi:hypothetical protein
VTQIAAEFKRAIGTGTTSFNSKAKSQPSSQISKAAVSAWCEWRSGQGRTRSNGGLTSLRLRRWFRSRKNNIRPFVVQNLGKYERQIWAGAEFGDGNGVAYFRIGPRRCVPMFVSRLFHS